MKTKLRIKERFLFNRGIVFDVQKKFWFFPWMSIYDFHYRFPSTSYEDAKHDYETELKLLKEKKACKEQVTDYTEI